MGSEGVKILESVGEAQCLFCYSDIPTGTGVMLNKCLHVFCKPCLVAAIEQTDAPQIECPIREEAHCGGCLLDPEIKSLISAQSYEQYLGRSMALAAKEDGQLYKCQQTDCSGMYFLEDGMKSFQCQICFQTNCSKCKGLHDEKSKCPRKKRKTANDPGPSDLLKRQRLEAEAEAKANIEMKDDWNARWEQMQSLVRESSSTSNGGSSQAYVDQLETSGVLVAIQPFECSICFVETGPGEGIILQDCFHTFCRDCLRATIEHSEDPEIKCPFQGAHSTCRSFIREREVKSLVSEELYEKYLARSICKAELCTGNAFHCKSLNCTGWCEAEEGAETFHCPICQKVNCIKCQIIHEVVSCEEYRNNLLHEGHDDESKKALNKLITSGKAMRCSTCKVIIVKNGGCDGIECRMCKTMLCWVTKGPRWGPKGTGDTSGGCRCRADGKTKCHKSCHGCH